MGLIPLLVSYFSINVDCTVYVFAFSPLTVAQSFQGHVRSFHRYRNISGVIG
jgi:hypothetical protein